MGYSRNVVQGFSWNGMLKILQIGVIAVRTFFITRLLTPNDYGLFSLVLIALGIMDAMTETGINTTILQSKKSVSYFVDTAWIIAIIRGFIISCIMIVAGFFMRGYYKEEGLLLLVAFASFVPAIKGFINPAIISLHKELNFFKDSLYRFSLICVESLFAIIFAIIFRSVYALLGGMIVAAVFEVAISFIFFEVRPQFLYLQSRAAEIFHNAKSLNITAILSYLVVNLDNVILGKVIGTGGLGLYAMGFSLSHKFNYELAKSVQYATFPVYVKIVDQRRRLRRAFWKSTITTLLGVTLISLPFILFPQLIVSIFFEGQWAVVGTILPLLAVAGIVQSFVTLSSTLFTAKKKYHWLNGSLFINCVFMIPLLFIWGSRYGLLGGVYAVLISRLMTLPFTCFGIWRTLRE